MMRLTCFGFSLFLLACNKLPVPADLIISGGTIYTVESSNPTAEAVVVRGDSIVFVGQKSEALKFKGDQTKEIDLQGKTLTPGFIEGHGHIMGLGYNEMNLDLMYLKNFDQILEKVKEAVGKVAPGEWIIGRGWHQDKWDTLPGKMVKGFPTHEKLSAISPQNPVVLEHASGHNILVNAKAMELAGVKALSRESIQVPVGGEIIRDNLGNPTGLFNETAADLITKVMPVPTEQSNSRALDLAIAACQRNGITSFQTAGENQSIINLFKKYKAAGKLGVRIYIMLSGSDSQLLGNYIRSGPDIDPDHWVTIRAIKLYSDGALGSRGAWLLEDYTDRSGHRGQPNMVIDSILTVSRKALKAGFQVCTHAIGDRANHEVLDQYEKAFRENPERGKIARFRIEHAQHLDSADIMRFGRLGIIAAMQAIHLSSDRPWAIERLGEKRIVEGAYVWKKLLNTGAVIVNGTDVPVEPINPIASFYASVFRKTLKGEPQGGYEADQAMTRAEALKSYTLDAAYGAFEENFKGSIRPGKLADFTVFTQDIMIADEKEMLGTEVAMTIVGGKIVYEKKK